MHNMQRASVIILVIGSLLPLSAETYQVAGDRRLTAVVKIRPGSHFETTTHHIGGLVSWRGGAINGRISVRLDTLESGIRLRDSHMREKTLHTPQYPDAVFEPQGLSGLADLKVGEVKQLVVKGRLTFHGTSRQVTAEVRAALQKGGSIQIDARLKLHLPDFGVEAPSLGFVQVEREVVVLVRFDLIP